MTCEKQKNALGKLSFEEAIKELANIVGKIEQGQIPLQDSLTQYEKGMALIKHCRTILQKAEKRIEKISKEQTTGTNQQKETEDD
jgi:exodeoxyribonuclease VII small subunit